MGDMIGDLLVWVQGRIVTVNLIHCFKDLVMMDDLYSSP